MTFVDDENWGRTAKWIKEIKGWGAEVDRLNARIVELETEIRRLKGETSVTDKEIVDSIHRILRKRSLI